MGLFRCISDVVYELVLSKVGHKLRIGDAAHEIYSVNNLRFTTLGGNYLWLVYFQLN